MKNKKYEMLVGSLQLMALPFEEQVEFLPDFVCYADEIALIFDDAKRLIENEDNLLSLEVRSRLSKLNKQLGEMSCKPDFWTLDALRKGKEWINCRQLAKSILNELNETLSVPSIDFIQFIKAK